MSPMSDQPLTLGDLAEFHRKVIVPDMHRTFESLFERLFKPRFDQIDASFDTVFHKLDKLDTEYLSLKAGLGRVEERLMRMDARFDRMDARFDGVEARLESLELQYQDLLAASHRLEERLRRVEERLGSVEGQVDALFAAQEKDPLRAEVADLRMRVDSLQAQVRSLEKRFDQ